MFNWNSLQRISSIMPVWQWCGAIVLIALAIWTIIRLRSLFREDADDADVKLEMLTQFRDLHQEGGLSDDEFRLIRSRLTRDVQAAKFSEPTSSKTIAVSNTSVNSSESPGGTADQSPDNHETTEKLEKSERMSDEITE